MKLNEKTILAAMAQVFSDYPERFTRNEFAKNKYGNVTSLHANDVFCFCSLGFLDRAEIEGLVTRKENLKARNLLYSAIKKIYGSFSIIHINDGPKGRKKIIAAALEISK